MDCPHCKVNIPNTLTQETLEARLKSTKEAKDGEILALTNSLSAASTKANGYDTLLQERDAALSKIQGIETAAARTTALTGVGITDASKLEGIEVIFKSANAGRADGDKLDFTAWIADEQGARAHPLLAPHFANAGPAEQAGAAAAAAAAAAGTAGANAGPKPGKGAGLPEGGAGGAKAPPSSTGKMTPQQVSAFFASKEFQSMKPEDQRAKTAELKATHMPNA